MIVLECSSRGDRRFSALSAEVAVFGQRQSIENHYQLAKRFGPIIPQTLREAKGRKPTHFAVIGIPFPLAWGPAWYDLLWVKYLDQHPELVAYAHTFDAFHDAFHTARQVVCQAESIRRYVQEGRAAILTRPDTVALLSRLASAPSDPLRYRLRTLPMDDR